MRFTQFDFAENYHKQMVEAGYPGKLLPFVMKELEDSYSVIDIGAGTGFFSIPLVMAGHSVTAVEPSAEMINLMRKNNTPDTIASINICNLPWESWNGDLHDAAISVHSLYSMRDTGKAVSMINRSAVKKILIVRDSSGMKTLSGIVREKFGLLTNRDLNSDITRILKELSAEWKLVNIHEERKHFIKDIQHEAESLLLHLKLDKGFKNDIIDILEMETGKSSESYFFNAIYSDNAYIF